MNMEMKLLQLLIANKEIYLLELSELMPEIKGEYSIYMPVKKGVNPNILWIAEVNKDFIKLFNELVQEKKTVKWKPVDIWTILYDGGPMYVHVPIASPKMAKTKRECFLPISIFIES